MGEAKGSNYRLAGARQGITLFLEAPMLFPRPRNCLTKWGSMSARRFSCVLLCTVTLITKCAVGQTIERSTSELVDSLKSMDIQQHRIIAGLFTCGETPETRRDRVVGRELVSRGKRAAPEIERALDSLEADGEDSPFFRKAGWLILAYARIEGAAGAPRLKRMIRSPKLDSLHITLDRAIALALGLTSYVSSGREDGPLILCRRQEPKDALDEVVLALERGDRSELESGIGSDARMALDQLLVGESWEAGYQELWRSQPGAQGAVGYLFEIPGRWSEPEETLEENRDYGNAPLGSTQVDLVTEFKTSSGKDCARERVRFQKVTESGRARYLVDNTNIKELINSIGVCFAQ